MAAYTQTSRSVSSTYYNYFVSQLGADAEYIIFGDDTYYYMVTGKYEGNNTWSDTTVYFILRSNNYGAVDTAQETSTTVSISYPYYAYSNIGIGTVLEVPAREELQTQFLGFISIVLVFILFGVALFKVIKKRWIL